MVEQNLFSDLVKVNNLLEVKKKIEDFIKLCEKDLERFSKHLFSLREKAEQISDSWSGSWAGFHAFLYYGDFEKPTLSEGFNIEWGSINGFSDKWRERTFDEVKQKIEKGIVKTNFEYIFEAVKPLVKQAKTLREYTCAELSYVNTDESLNDEKKLLTQIDEIDFGTSANEFVSNLQPSQTWTRDSRAATQGMKVPPHIKYKAQVMAVLSMISDLEKFNNIIGRLVRQLEIKFQLNSQGQDFMDSLDKIKVLCDKFYSVSRQLRNRHINRPTLEIEDEYDVQDLFHALLKIYFDDIRNEEWVPSFAGSSSRVDFLLKREKLVIEIKKTNINLKDKELGEQLVLDVAKYKSHPDCKTLVCFIYDPEGRIANPTGLITDITKQSNKELSVVVIIKPTNN